ncbi:STAS domain-containing protein [Streptomyces montanisoli]|uniref:STAS domain-containing protein n=1 Tax=Streptomyces montanisoli TaxID=2798581 RepID=A0A940MMK2_9ACTN|nr:STAS domain-containing protein [Streptomyces montanisoli]MBP0462196.1 hypothetical protein [Streptomyces montanisoli]
MRTRSSNSAHPTRPISLAMAPQAEEQPVSTSRAEGVLVLRLAGALYASDAGDLALDARRHADAARALGHRLVFDLTDVTLLSGAAAAALAVAAHESGDEREGDGEPTIAVVADAHIRAVLTRALPPSIGVHATIGEALA